jgi:signal peptidase I
MAGRGFSLSSAKRRSGAAAVVIAAALALTCLPTPAAQAFSLEFGKYYLPSWSMAPTLLQNDYFITLPREKPGRGDLIVYRLPRDPSTIYLKRIVGLPGDTVQVIGGALSINGTPVARERIEDFDLSDGDGKTIRVRQWRETLPGGVSHRTLDTIANGFLDNTAPYTVPAGHYFLMGDNRDNSSDSRLIAQHGAVPAENIVGRVGLIYFSIAPGESVWKLWRWPWSVRWDRIFSQAR